MNITIRQYSSSDLNAVLDTWEVATRLAHRFMTEDFIAQERKNTAEIYLPNTDTWVAEIDGKVKGFIALMGNEVGALFLQPSLNRKGIGTLLMNKARELQGDLEVDVFKENIGGHHFYTQYGFEYMKESLHEPTGQKVIRLKYSARNIGG